MRLKGPGTCEAAVVHKVQVGSIELHQIIENALPGVETESIRSYSSNITERIDISRGVLDWAFIPTKLVRSGEERYARKLVKMFHSDSFDIETIRSKVNSVTTCSKLVRGNTFQILEKGRSLK